MIRRRTLLLAALAGVLLWAGLAWAQPRLDRPGCDRFYYYSPQHGRCVGNLEFDSPIR